MKRLVIRTITSFSLALFLFTGGLWFYARSQPIINFNTTEVDQHSPAYSFDATSAGIYFGHVVPNPLGPQEIDRDRNTPGAAAGPRV